MREKARTGAREGRDKSKKGLKGMDESDRVSM